MKNFSVVITDKIGNSRSVLSKNNLYCFEGVCDIFRRSLRAGLNVPDEKIYYGTENHKNGPILYIMPDCFGMPKKALRRLVSNGNAFYKKGGRVLACFDTGQNSDRFGDYKLGRAPVQNLRELREKSARAHAKLIARLEQAGVQFTSLDGVCISPLANIAPGVIIYPGTIIRGRSVIGAGCILGPNTLIDNSRLGEGCVINSSQIYSSTLERSITVGPFAHIRPSCVIKSGVHLGNFVEAKNSNIGEGTKAGHLTYIGDSDVGARVNFGCGSITVNYDGVRKARCDIRDDAFIGSNVNLVAPLKIGEKAFIAAGSTITREVPPDTLAISRTREQTLKENWSELRAKAGKIKSEN